MAEYEIKDVVCDYGIYEDGELILILDSAYNAHIIKRILEIDQSVPNCATPANVVEVVRCRDCKRCDHRFPAKAIGEEAIEGWYCGKNRCYMKPDDFCSYGERKEK